MRQWKWSWLVGSIGGRLDLYGSDYEDRDVDGIRKAGTTMPAAYEIVLDLPRLVIYKYRHELRVFVREDLLR